jgi:trk system potassium uptake protein TrkA
MTKHKQFLIIGLGGFGGSVLTRLTELGYEVLAIDENEDVVQEYSEIATRVVQADAADESVLNSLGVRNFDVAIVAMAKDIESSVYITMLLKDMGIPLVITKSEDPVHAKILLKIGADKVINPESESGIRMAQNLVSENALCAIDLVENYALLEMKAPAKYVGKKLHELDIKLRLGITVIGIRREGILDTMPSANEIIRENDDIVFIGGNENIVALQNGKL